MRLTRASCHADGEVSAGWGSLARVFSRSGVSESIATRPKIGASAKRRRVVLLGQWLGQRRRWRPWSEPPPSIVVRTHYESPCQQWVRQGKFVRTLQGRPGASLRPSIQREEPAAVNRRRPVHCGLSWSVALMPHMGRTQAILTAKDVVRLLRQRVAKAGGQSAWAKKTGVHRTLINRVLREQQAPTKSIVNALQLDVVYLPKKRRRTR